MRAVVKLERRFNGALEKIEAATSAGADDPENSKLREQVATLDAAQSQKDEDIKKLQESTMALNEKIVASANEATVQKLAATAAQKDAADNLTLIETTKNEAANQISALEAKLKVVETETADVPDQTAKVAELQAEVETRKAELKILTERTEDYFARMRRLRGTLRQVRTKMKAGLATGDDINDAMFAELEGLQAQRELDLNEINIVLEKLTPLVEGK